jgi:hypothetical protein
LEGKRLALLHQLVPASETIAALLNPKNPSVDIQAQNLQDAGRKLGRQIRIIYAANDMMPPSRRSASSEFARSHWGAATRTSVGDESKSSHWQITMQFPQCTLDGNFPK